MAILLAFEHICLMCKNTTLQIPHASEKGKMPFGPSESLETISSSLPSQDTSEVEEPSRRGAKVTVVPFSFEILKLFEKSQQVELLFSSLIQETSFTADASAQMSNDVCNELLFERFVTMLKNKLSMREIELSHQDMIRFPQSVDERPSRTKEVPFPKHYEFEANQEVSAWKCFAHLNNDGLFVVVLPASFKDLKLLVSCSYKLPVSQIPEQCLHVTVKTDEFTKEPAADSDLKDPELSQCNESRTVVGSLTIPIYIYRSNSSMLADQLVFSESSKKGRDIFLNNLNRSETYSEVTAGSRKTSMIRRESLTETTTACLALDFFIKEVTDVFWSALYKTVLEGLQIADQQLDKQDIAGAIGMSSYLGGGGFIVTHDTCSPAERMTS